MSRVENKEIREKFEHFVLLRFESIQYLKNKMIDDFRASSVEIVIKLQDKEEDMDWEDNCLIGEMTIENELYSFDIWYLNDNIGNMVITEVGYGNL